MNIYSCMYEYIYRERETESKLRVKIARYFNAVFWV